MMASGGKRSKAARKKKLSNINMLTEDSVDDNEVNAGASTSLQINVNNTQAEEESPFATNNPFQPLQTIQNEEMDTSPAPKIKRPPPIFIQNLTNYKLLVSQLTNKLGNTNFTCLNRLTETKIITETSDDYRSTVKYLEEIKAQFHTYQLREERAFRVVIRNLHHSTPTDVIKEELTKLGYKVRHVTNVVNHRRQADNTIAKVPLPLFYVDLEQDPTSQNIYTLEKLYHTKVRVEKPFQKREIIQCSRCQKYGHTKGYCHYAPRCIKCGKEHSSYECTKPRDIPATCALCSQPHPANYKGCQVYQELKHRRAPPQMNMGHRQPTQPAPTNRLVVPSISYASAAAGKRRSRSQSAARQTTVEETPQPQMPDPVTLREHLRRQHPHQSTNCSTIPPPAQSNDITTILTSFLREFQSMIAPLISLLNVFAKTISP